MCLSFIIIVKAIKTLSIFSPIFLIAFGFINKENIFLSESLLIKRWGSLYEEFKINKGFASCQFYSIFLLRRLFYCFSQTFFNEFNYFQQALNIVGSLVQTSYMAYYLPYKDIYIGVSCYIGEICTLLVMITSLFFSKRASESTIMLLENIIIYSVLGTILIQTLISFILLWKSIKELCIRFNNYRVLQILRNARKVLPLEITNKDYSDTSVADPSNFRSIDQRHAIEEIR